MLGKAILVFLAAIAALGGIGFLQMRRKAAAAPQAGEDAEKRREDKIVENVADLNDRFNRARYMGQDGN